MKPGEKARIAPNRSPLAMLNASFAHRGSVAAHTVAGFQWGRVWEWTATPFAPYPGFVPHPYVDYSAPWFDGRPVLKGASQATSPRMRHPKYRNYFERHRNDIMAGFRSVV